MKQRPDIGYHQALVLIVDDERHNRELLEVMLTPEGLLLQTAASGEEALDMIVQQPPDLILLDIMMPGMDGFQVAAKLKGNLATRNIPLIMVTALGDREARLRGLNAGAEDFLTKPVDRVELCVRVRNLLRLKAYGDYYDKYSQMLEGEVVSRTADLLQRTKQAAVLAEQAALLDLAQDAIVVRDMDGRIVFWSRGAEVMYGWLRDEALGRNAFELLKTKLSEPKELAEAVLLSDGQWEGEAIHHKRDGTRMVVASRWALQRDGEGAAVRILTINNDTTEHKRAESQRLLLAEGLEQVRHDQLQFKDDFLSHVSHELRSPLTAIKQFTTILAGGLAGELNKEQLEYQQIVLKNVRQLQSMIDDLLEVTRLETGKLTVEPESVSVADAVTDTFNTLEGTARAKGITLSFNLEPELPYAFADQTRLRQILIILLDNAIKFTPDSGDVSIRARLQEQDPRFMVLDVSDTGCGISPAATERIFERLYQRSESIQASRKGLGLGLYICKELVTRQGGQIWVQGEQERGSTFSFTLPVFSFKNVLAPLLKNDEWPTKSVAVVMVETCLTDASPSRESQDAWAHEARSLLQRCLLPDLDILLPNMRIAEPGERFFVAAFANETGASVLANRIRGQFERHPRVTQKGATLSVSYSVLPALPRSVGASMDSIVTSMATHLEESIKSHSLRAAA